MEPSKSLGTMEMVRHNAEITLENSADKKKSTTTFRAGTLPWRFSEKNSISRELPWDLFDWNESHLLFKHGPINEKQHPWKT